MDPLGITIPHRNGTLWTLFPSKVPLDLFPETLIGSLRRVEVEKTEVSPTHLLPRHKFESTDQGNIGTIFHAKFLDPEIGSYIIQKGNPKIYDESLEVILKVDMVIVTSV